MNLASPVAEDPLATSHPHRFEGVDSTVGEQLDSARASYTDQHQRSETTLWNVLCLRRVRTLVPRYLLTVRADAPNQPLVSTILPSTEPDARSSIACLASSSGKVV